MNITLQTQNLVLKPIQLSDAEAIFHFFTPTVTTYMYPAPARTIQDTLDFIHASIKLREENKEVVWVARLKLDETFVGCMGLHHINTRTPELGVWIQEGFFGKKLGLEGMSEIIRFAREKVPHDYLIYPVDRRNYPSRNIPESFGGILKKTYQTTGRAGNVLDIIEYWIYPEHQDVITWPTFLFQGDSITDCGRNRSDLYSLGDGYVKQLKHEFPKVTFINKGVSGDRTEELINRWEYDVIAFQPDVLSLLCGVNDVWHYYHFGKPIDQETFEKNYRHLIETTQTKSPHTFIILIEPFSYNIGAFDPSWRPMLESFILTVRKLAKHYHLPIIHMDDYMQTWKKMYAQEDILGDGVHPSELGHRLMAHVIKPILRNHLLHIQEKNL